MTYFRYYLNYGCGQRELAPDHMAVRKTARVQNKDIMHPNSNFLQLNRSKNPGETRAGRQRRRAPCPQVSNGTIPGR